MDYETNHLIGEAGRFLTCYLATAYDSVENDRFLDGLSDH